MQTISRSNHSRQPVLSVASSLALALSMPIVTLAQNKPNDISRQVHTPASGSQSLADQIRKLQATVAELEIALKQKHQAVPPRTSGDKNTSSMGSAGQAVAMQGMGMMGRGMMGGRGGMMGRMGRKNPPPEKTMSEKGKMGGMGMMGRMKSSPTKKAPEPLPAFPGAPGNYHIGATGFYLDQTDQITLTPEQQRASKQIKDKAMSEQAAFEEQIKTAEEELGKLTGSDQPDVAKIDAKVCEIERLRADQRMAFIRSVGQAAAVLTDEQRKTLTAQHPTADDAPQTDAKPQP